MLRWFARQWSATTVDIGRLPINVHITGTLNVHITGRLPINVHITGRLPINVHITGRLPKTFT